MDKDLPQISWKAFILPVIMLVLIAVYVIVKQGKRNRNCAGLMKSTPVAGISKADVMFQRPVRDFVIKSSYNSCASGSYKNDYVDLCALIHAIKEGCRFLDFEIYNIDNEPVVAVSDSVKYSMKHCYNYIRLADVFKCIENEAFAATLNGMDPLFLNFRIKSDHLEIYDAIADLLKSDRYTTLNMRLLGPKYSYEYFGHNLGKINLSDLVEKVVILADKSNGFVKDSKLNEYVNLGGHSPFLRIISFQALKTEDVTELKDYTLKRLVMCTPMDSTNYKSSATMPLGIQISAMNFQTLDDNLTAYNKTFVDRGNHAFYRKPDVFVPVTVDAAPALPKSMSYDPKHFASKIPLPQINESGEVMKEAKPLYNIEL